jgi:integrase
MRHINRIKWLLRKAGWLAQTRTVCRADILDFFARTSPAEVGLKPSSFANYKSDILAALDAAPKRARKRSVMDIGGVWRQLHEEIHRENAEGPELSFDMRCASGPFLVYLADRNINLDDVAEETLSAYYAHRVAHGAKDEETCKKHVKRVARLFTALSTHPRFAHFNCPAVQHPFPDGRDKFGVADGEVAGLLRDWDRRVAPWASGDASRTGQTRDEFIAEIDTAEEASRAVGAGRRRRPQRLNRRRKEHVAGKTKRDEKLRQHGFLTEKDQWSAKTACTRRGYISALAKAHLAATGECIETIEELCDPEILEDMAISLADANAGDEFESDYLASILKTIRKVAVGFVQADEESVQCIDDLIEEYACARRGIAPRNKAKLQQFDPCRIQSMIDLTDLLVADVNRTIAARREALRRETGVLPKPLEVYDAELACRVMAAIGHAIMMKRGPRSANLIAIRLDWVRWQNDHATIIIPASEIKMRSGKDPDLPIPLGASVSRLLRAYVDGIREKALLPGDERNPYLFPGQDRRRFTLGQPYKGILQRVVKRVHKMVGVKINPHLYRHLIGWIWLRDNLDNLPKVQKLLGHTSLQTTIDHYAEIDEELALDEWQQRLEPSER